MVHSKVPLNINTFSMQSIVNRVTFECMTIKSIMPMIANCISHFELSM